MSDGWVTPDRQTTDAHSHCGRGDAAAVFFLSRSCVKCRALYVRDFMTTMDGCMPSERVMMRDTSQTPIWMYVLCMHMEPSDVTHDTYTVVAQTHTHTHTHTNVD